MIRRAEPHFSFSGLKTALRHEAARLAPLREADIRDLCASFQQAIVELVADRVRTAMAMSRGRQEPGRPLRLVTAGGVAANQRLRTSLAVEAEAAGFSLHVPPVALCGDNAAMIAWAGAERLARGLVTASNFEARARWPLDDTAPKAIGAGVKA